MTERLTVNVAALAASASRRDGETAPPSASFLAPLRPAGVTVGPSGSFPATPLTAGAEHRNLSAFFRNRES